MAATDAGAREIGTTGASFVMIGMGVWAAELAELDAAATAGLLRALGDFYDPKSSPEQKARADAERSRAVRSIFDALDLMMAGAAGNG